MCPIAQADRHDCPRLVDETVPGKAAVIDDVVVGLEDAVGEPVVADELPDVFDRVEFGRLRRQWHQGDIVGDVELRRKVPAGLIEQQNGMGSGRHRSGDLDQMQSHGGGIAAWQNKAGGDPLGRADGPEDVGRARPLIVRCRGARPALGPSPGDLVLLSNPGLVLKPHLYRLARRVALGDLVEAGGEVFLNAASVAAS